MLWGTLVGQQVIHSLTLGCIYACLTVGLTFLYGAQRSLSLAYGGVYALGGYVAWWAIRVHQARWLALVLAVLLCTSLGLCLWRGLRIVHTRTSERAALLSGVGLLICLEELYRWGIGPYPMKVMAIDSRQIHHLGPLLLTDLHWLVFGCAFVLFVGIHGFLMTSYTGRALYAFLLTPASASPGPRSAHLPLVACSLGAALAGMGGVLTGLYLNEVYPAMGTHITHKVAGLVLIGTLGNLRGALLMAFVWAFLEGMFFPSTRAWVPPEALLLLALALASGLQAPGRNREKRRRAWQGRRLRPPFLATRCHPV
jgi:branched-subunit amino acid ABC-type transport system permease component